MGSTLSLSNGIFHYDRALDKTESRGDLFSVEEYKPPKKDYNNSSMANVLTSNSGANNLLTKGSKVICTRAWKVLPLPMKAPQGVFIEKFLYIGGGYTKSFNRSSNIYVCRDASDSWTTLPPLSQALKLSALTSLGHKLVLLGGKESNPDTWGSTASNRVEVWDTEKEIWEESLLPPMIAPRVSPVVVRHNSYIIVAGGNPGMLDFRAELLDTSASPLRWLQCPNLPLHCNSKTSAVVGNRWYLLDTNKGNIFYTELSYYINQALCDQSENCGSALKDLRWEKLPSKPSEDVIPFKLAVSGSHLIAFANIKGKLVMHLLQEDETWLMITGQGLPLTIHSSALVLSREEEDSLLVLGGENSAEFSDRTYKVSFTTSTRLKEIKRKWRVTLKCAQA